MDDKRNVSHPKTKTCLSEQSDGDGAAKTNAHSVLLDGESLTAEQLVSIGYDWNVKIDLTPQAWGKVQRGRDVVDRVISKKQIAYGINTVRKWGFARVCNELQRSGKRREYAMLL